MIVLSFQGVIFSIDCSMKYKMLTTTSDDRSLKIWNLKFDDTAELKLDWSACTIEPSKSLFGHIARVFSHKIIEYNGNAYIITVGEDGNVCTWCTDGRLINREPIARGVLWNLEYDSFRQYVFACGNDGNVHQYKLSNILNETQYVSTRLDIIGVPKNDFITKLVVLQASATVVVLTNKQQIFYGQLPKQNLEYQWTPLAGAETGYNITVLETHASLVITAGYEFITIYQWDHGRFRKVFHDRPPLNDRSPLLRSLKFIAEYEFVICDARGNGSLIQINEHFQLTNDHKFQMPPSKEPWLTVAARFQQYLVIGDRHGNMHLYEIGETIALKHTLRHVHGNLGCKTIYQTMPSQKPLEFESAGHQSKVKTIVINETTSELELKSTHDIPIKWCDKTVRLDDRQNTLLAGFNERHFIACRHDVSYRFEIDCGGGHRAWDLHIDKSTMEAHLFFVRNKIMYGVKFNLHDRTVHPFNIVTYNWHTWPCNAMRILPLTDEKFLCVSGGDDNLLKFNEIIASTSTTQPFQLQHKFDMVLHISNVRSVYSLKQPASNVHDLENWLIFSAGGRAQICVTQVTVGPCRTAQFHEICDFMLRSSDLERKRKKHTQLIYFDPETRFMSLVAYQGSGEINLIVGCSDGFIRQFKYADASITLSHSVFYGRCILNVHHFVYANRNIVISMATDGLLVFWWLDHFNEESAPFLKVQHHDSGINAFDAMFSGTNKLTIATGGDDQSIVISELNLHENENDRKISVRKTIKFADKHTAQVNGITFSTDKKYLYSASVDQTIMRVQLSDHSIEQINYSCISDAKGLQTFDTNKILIYGCGMQILDV